MGITPRIRTGGLRDGAPRTRGLCLALGHVGPEGQRAGDEASVGELGTRGLGQSRHP